MAVQLLSSFLLYSLRTFLYRSENIKKMRANNMIAIWMLSGFNCHLARDRYSEY